MLTAIEQAHKREAAREALLAIEREKEVARRKAIDDEIAARQMEENESESESDSDDPMSFLE